MSLMICSEGVFAVPDFCLIFAPRLATMSQKSSFPHPTDSVQYVLTSNSPDPKQLNKTKAVTDDNRASSPIDSYRIGIEEQAVKRLRAGPCPTIRGSVLEARGKLPTSTHIVETRGGIARAVAIPSWLLKAVSPEGW